ENGSGGIFFGARQFRVRERTEWRRFFSHADIARNEIGLFERDVEARVVREFEHERFLHFAVRRRHASELKKAADPMFEMNDEIAFIEFAKIDLGTIARELLRALQAAPAVRGISAEQFGGGKDNEFSIRKNE